MRVDALPACATGLFTPTLPAGLVQTFNGALDSTKCRGSKIAIAIARR